MIDNNSFQWYSQFYDHVIYKNIEKMREDIYNIDVYFSEPDAVKKYIFENYIDFRDNCKRRYMLHPERNLDRHKIVACMVFAILKVHPLVCTIPVEYNQFDVINERLAINSGLSLHTSMLLSALDNRILTEPSNKEQLEKYKNVIKERGIILPNLESINHGGSYKENFETQLHFNRVENCYDVLGLSNTLYLLELHTLSVIDSEMS